MASELLKYLNKQLGVMIKCKTEKVKLTNYHKGFLSKSFFVYCNILSNTYVIYVFENFLRSLLRRKPVIFLSL